MENPTLGIRCRIVAKIPTGIHRFDGDSHKIRSDSCRIRVGPVVGLNLLGINCILCSIICVFFIYLPLPLYQSSLVNISYRYACRDRRTDFVWSRYGCGYTYQAHKVSHACIECPRWHTLLLQLKKISSTRWIE